MARDLNQQHCQSEAVKMTPRGANGFLRKAEPTARKAFGEPIFIAKSL